MARMMFEQRSVRLPQGELSYFVAGSGRPIVHLHGAGGVRPNLGLTRLSESLALYLPVLPGFDGMSEFAGVDSMQGLAGVVADFIDAVIGEAADVLGLSFGGWLAAWLAVLYPDKVAQLCLENPAGFLPLDAPPLSDDPTVRLREMYVYPERRPPETKSEAVLAKNRALLHDYHGPLRRDEALIARLGDIQCLTMILHGTHDGRVPKAAVQELKRQIPHSHLIYVYNAAHSLETDQPERFSRLVADFMQRAEAFLVNPGKRDR